MENGSVWTRHIGGARRALVSTVSIQYNRIRRKQYTSYKNTDNTMQYSVQNASMVEESSIHTIVVNQLSIIQVNSHSHADGERLCLEKTPDERAQKMTVVNGKQGRKWSGLLRTADRLLSGGWFPKLRSCRGAARSSPKELSCPSMTRRTGTVGKRGNL